MKADEGLLFFQAALPGIAGFALAKAADFCDRPGLRSPG
jgi:hypothetical protein